jgi:hypothetical protein
MFEEAYGRTVLPVLKPGAAANVPGRRMTAPISYDRGMPGAHVGQ